MFTTIITLSFFLTYTLIYEYAFSRMFQNIEEPSEPPNVEAANRIG
ncbi:hypothetical protein [Oculatella sp. LEGE 06141]|nr:hypothetical protein [Oculatella sp. LEGE 06141]